MLNNIIDYFKNTIDENVEIKEYVDIENIPVYLKEIFNFYQCKFLDNNALLIESKKGNITLPTLKKRLELINNYTNKNIIVLYDSLSVYQRKKLIKERIAYIVMNRQMYLPFIYLDLHESNKIKQNKKINKFSTSAQVAYLYLLYNNRDIAIDEFSKILKRSKMTASRVLGELYNAKLITCKIKGKTGRKRYYRRIGDPQYFIDGYHYLKSPILNKIKIYRSMDIKGVLKAGLSALSEKSMINTPKYRIYAIGKMMESRIKQSSNLFISDNEEFDKEPVMEIEIWAYDPWILSKTEAVDILSLKLSFVTENNERIQSEIDNLMGKQIWYRE